MANRGDRTEQPPPAKARGRVRLSPLGRDITVVLLVKFAALGLLWLAFFNHPVAQRAPLDSPRIEAHVVPSPSPETPHADR